MFTVGAPITIGAPHPAMSPTRSAGRPPIMTVGLPIGNGVGGCTAGGGKLHVCRSPTTAAGIPPIMTVGTPGPVTTPGCPVGSPTRAANGTVPPSVDRDHRAADGRLAGARDLGRAT